MVRRRSFPVKKSVLAALAVLSLAGGLLYWQHSKNNSKLVAGQNANGTVTGTVSQPTSHNTNPTSPNLESGGATDNQGQVSGSLPPSSQWTTSSSGAITLQQPTSNSTIKSGNSLSGTANTSTVQFILKDNSVGVVAQGSLNVVDGKFSGVLSFTAHSKTGSLEVYSPKPSNGAAENVIDINLNFE